MTGKPAEQKKNDWILRVLALVFAVMLWFYADAEQNPVIGKHFDIPIQYENQAEYYIVENPVKTVRVTIRGKETDLSGLRSDDFTAMVDLSDAVVGDSEYQVQVTAPNVVERFSYLPDKVMVIIDQVQTKEVPVHVQTSGTLPAGYELTSTEVVPATVTIAGLSQILDKISEVQTQVIDISSFTQEITQEVALRAADGVTLKSGKQVAVHFLIQQEQSHSNYEANIEVQNIPDGMNATLEQLTATLRLSGSAALVENQKELNKLQLYVDCTGLQAGQHELPIQVNYSGTLGVTQIEPATVKVTLTADGASVTDPVDENNNNNGNINNNMNNNTNSNANSTIGNNNNEEDGTEPTISNEEDTN